MSCITGYAQEKFNEIVNTEVAFLDDFSSNKNNWPTVVNDSLGLRLADGKYYTMAAKTNITLPKQVNLSLAYQNNLWRLSTEVEYVEGNGFFGLLYGSIAYPTTYAFMINGNRDFVILKTVKDKTEVLIKGNSSKINIGKGAKNILCISSAYNILNIEAETYFYVNGSRVQNPTKAEQAKIDLANEEIKKKNGGNLPITLDDFMNIGKNFIPLEPLGNGKIGIIVTKATVVNFDNLKLEVKPNKGNIIMRNNEWSTDATLTKYLSKELLEEDRLGAEEYKKSKLEREREKMVKAKESIGRLSENLLYPFGKTYKKAIPNDSAVAWLQEFKLSLSSSISSPLGFYEEKDLLSKNDSSETYQVRHYLPKIKAEARVQVNTKSKIGKFIAIIRLGEDLNEVQAIELCSNYLANIAAAFDHYGNKYIDVNEDKTDKTMPRQLYINDGGDFVSNKVTKATVKPVKGNNGWNVYLHIFL